MNKRSREGGTQTLVVRPLKTKIMCVFPKLLVFFFRYWVPGEGENPDDEEEDSEDDYQCVVYFWQVENNDEYIFKALV